MGDAFNNDLTKRLEIKLGDGTASGKKVIPVWKNPNGDTIKIPQLSNMLLNLSKYAFSLNNLKSCSQYIDGSDLPIGKCTYTSGQRSIGGLPFGDKLAENQDNFTGVSNSNYALNTSKGVYFQKKGISPNIGFLLPKNGEVLTNAGDSFTFSITFAFNNATVEWTNMFGFIPNNGGISNDGLLRVEKYSGNALSLYWNPSSSGSANGVELISADGHDTIHNLIIRGTRRSGTQNDELIVDVWFNGARKATSQNLGTYRGNPKNLVYFNSGRDDTTAGANCFYLACRVWDVGLNDTEITMLQKIEARNIGLQELNPNGINLWNYLNS